jgi:hypothetical protein
MLNTNQREVLVLVAVHGLSYDRVAEICGCEVGTVKSRVNRARAMLKHILLEDALPLQAEGLPVGKRPARPLEPGMSATAAGAAGRLRPKRGSLPGRQGPLPPH